MTTAYCVNEWTALGFLARCLTGKQPVVLSVEPILPPLLSLMQRLADWALNNGRARSVAALCPDLQPLQDYPTRVLLHDVFGRLESWHNDYYRYDSSDPNGQDLAFAYRQITCNHVRWKHHGLLLIERLRQSHPDLKVVGVSPDTQAMAKRFSGDTVSAWKIPSRLINGFLSLALTSVAVVWVLSRLRPKVKTEYFFFGADYLSDPRDHEIYDEVSEGGPILLVPREPSRVVPPDLARRYKVVTPTSGRLSLGTAAALLPTLLVEAWTLLLRYGAREPSHFWALAALPWRRAVLRAFFCRYRPRVFWGRDDYNVEHVLRRQEIHRVGGQSWGINHGYPAYSILFPMWRYISFDRYYVFGRALYDRYMKATWASDMEIVPVGTFGANRQQYAIAQRDRPRDIVVFTAVAVGHPAMVNFVRRLAQSFPDRRLLLQVKSTFINLPMGQDFIAACTRDLPQVVAVGDSMFDLFAMARYSFSDPSTVVVEAMQFGLMSFNVDILPEQRVSLLREFDGLCVTCADQAADRIRSIEDGSWKYPRECYKQLVDLSGWVIFDAIRRDLGLTIRQPPRPLSDLLQEISS